MLADRHEARLCALALDAYLFGIELDAADVEVHEFLGSEPARVGELEEGAVTLLERRRGRDLVEQGRDVLRLERLREAVRQLRRGQQVGGVGRHLAVLEQAAEEAAGGG